MPTFEETTHSPQTIGFQLDWSENQLDSFVSNQLTGNFQLAFLQVDRISYQTLGKDRILSVLNSLADSRAKLQHLEIEDNADLGVAGALAVTNIVSATTKLRTLAITHCDLPQKAWKIIAKGMRASTSLCDVNLSHNQLGCDDMMWQMTDLLGNVCNLRKLNLSNNGIRIDGKLAAALGRLLTNTTTLQHLDVGGNTQAQTSKKSQAGLRIRHTGDATAFVQGLQRNKTLRVLKLSRSRVCYEDAHALIEALTHNKSLRHLDLAGNWVNFRALEALGKLLDANSSLTHLDISQCYFPMLDDDDDDSQDARGAVAFARALTQHVSLRSLNLSGNYLRRVDTCAISLCLLKNTALHTLRLRNIAAIKAAAPVAYANASGTQTDASSAYNILPILMCLSHTKHLRHVDLGFNRLDDVLATSLAHALRENHSIQYLDISRNSLIRKSGMHTLCDVFATNDSMLVLKLGEMYDSDSVHALTTMLLRNTTVQLLDITCNYGLEHDFSSVINALAHNTALQHLALNGRLPQKAAAAAAAAHTQSFYCDNAVRALAGIVDKNSSLHTVYMPCDPSPNVVHALFDTLQHCPRYIPLDIRGFDVCNVVPIHAQGFDNRLLGSTLHSRVQADESKSKAKSKCDVREPIHMQRGSVSMLAGSSPERGQPASEARSKYDVCEPTYVQRDNVSMLAGNSPERGLPARETRSKYDVCEPAIVQRENDSIPRNSTERSLLTSETESKHDVCEHADAQSPKDHNSRDMHGKTVQKRDVCESTSQVCKYADSQSFKEHTSRDMHGKTVQNKDLREPKSQVCVYANVAPQQDHARDMHGASVPGVHACEATPQVCMYADLMWSWRHTHCEKAFAFAMGNHSRLGQGSLVRYMNWDCVRMVVLSFFGMPLDSCNVVRKESEYVAVLAAVTLKDD
jgi:Ran GTPase-activating protein (RanGAP) involved in mRNA processing and transport